MGYFNSLIRKFTSAPERPRTGEEPGRNEPCWCGSGKKYKHCHYEKDRARGGAARSCGPGG